MVMVSHAIIIRSTLSSCQHYVNLIIMSTAPPSSWEAKHHSDNPGSCEFARETIEVRESLCFFGYGGPRGRQTIQRIPKEGLCFCRFRWRSRKAIAQKWKLALLFNNVKQLTVSEHLWKMRPKKCARDCRKSSICRKIAWPMICAG